MLYGGEKVGYEVRVGGGGEEEMGKVITSIIMH